MITEDFVSFEVAKLLKEKGSDEPCNGRYSYRGGNVVVENYPISNESLKYHPNIDGISAPTLQMTMKWLREVHQLHISVDVCPIYGKVKDEKGRNTCGFLYWHYMASGEWMNDKYNPQQRAFVASEKSYKNVVEAALKYSLENLI